VTSSQIRIGPSILSANFLKLGEELADAEAAGVDFIHFDVMDGQFVPNISFGLPVLEAIRKATSLPIDVHLMIVQPERYIAQFVEAGADTVTLHAEASLHLNRALHMIAEAGATPSVSINPATPLTAIEEVVSIADQILIMTVNPGFGGQSFIPTMLSKITRLRAMIDEKNPACRLEVDGGVKAENIARIVAAGADTFVVGSAVFRPGVSIQQAMTDLRTAVPGP
jgi:ribulose-phosphate 3-epimerase